MKKVNFKKIIVTTMFFGAAITSMAQSKEAKKAIKEAEIFSIYFRNPSFLSKGIVPIILEEDFYIGAVDGDKPCLGFGINRYKHLFVTPGSHVILADFKNYHGEPFSVDVDSGKFYKISIKSSGTLLKTTNSLHIDELTDPELILKAQNILEEEREKQVEFKNKFLKFQEQNPTQLEGNWIGEKSLGLGKKKFFQYSFEGEKIRYKYSQGKSKDYNGYPAEAEGRLFYSENLIVFVPLEGTLNKIEWTGLTRGPNIIWYYTKINDELHFQKTTGIGSDVFPGYFTGVFKKN